MIFDPSPFSNSPCIVTTVLNFSSIFECKVSNHSPVLFHQRLNQNLSILYLKEIHWETNEFYHCISMLRVRNFQKTAVNIDSSAYSNSLFLVTIVLTSCINVSIQYLVLLEVESFEKPWFFDFDQSHFGLEISRRRYFYFSISMLDIFFHNYCVDFFHQALQWVHSTCREDSLRKSFFWSVHQTPDSLENSKNDNIFDLYRCSHSNFSQCLNSISVDIDSQFLNKP